MTSREFFEAVLADLTALDKLRRRRDEAESACQPRSAGFGGSGRGTGGDSTARYDALIELRDEVDRTEMRVDREVERATAVLYGTSGHGGYARARSATDADIVFGRYLMGMSWLDVAEAVCAPEGPAPDRWCRMRASRAFDAMDKLGMVHLADS